MISVSKALQIIQSQALFSKEKEVLLCDAVGSVLSEDVVSPIHMPPFRQSAMDGYALKWSADSDYILTHESQAGSFNSFSLRDHEAVRIFTGAVVPDDADTVVIQEHVEKKEDHLLIYKMPSKNANIRAEGEQIQKGEIALKKGTLIQPAAVGFLACLGIEKVKVYKSPKIGVLVTGDELQSAGSPLEPGRIYESNSSMLQAVLKETGIREKIKVLRVRDNLEHTKKMIKCMLEEVDILLISGGISVGEYDFVKRGLEANDVEELFYKINQKPGKPMWFGRRNKSYVFALPGNPASVLTCFYVYVYPFIQAWKGCENFELQRSMASCNEALVNKSGKTLFLKASLSDSGDVSPLMGQSSAMMYTYALSNALICIPEEKGSVEIGEDVECLRLPL